MRGRIVGVDFGKEFHLSAGRNQFDQRRLMAHPHAADALDHGRRAAFGQHLLDPLVDLPAALRHAARAQPDANFAQFAAGRDDFRCLANRAVLLMFEEIVQHFADHRGSQMAVGDAVDLNDRGQRAAAQAGDLFEREKPLGIGVFAVAQMKLPREGVLHQARPLHVASGPVANAG